MPPYRNDFWRAFGRLGSSAEPSRNDGAFWGAMIVKNGARSGKILPVFFGARTRPLMPIFRLIVHPRKAPTWVPAAAQSGLHLCSRGGKSLRRRRRRAAPNVRQATKRSIDSADGRFAELRVVGIIPV